MSVERTPSQPPDASAAEDAHLEAERAAEHRRRRARLRHHIGQRHGVTFKHTAPGSQVRKPHHLEDARRRLVASGLPHKVAPRNGEGRGGQGRPQSGGGQHRGGQQNGQHGGQHRGGQHGGQHGGQQQQQQPRQQQQQQKQQPPRDDGPRRQAASAGDAAALRVGAAAARRTAQVDQPESMQNGAGVASEPTPSINRARSNPLQALVAQWSDRPLLLENNLAAQWTELYLRTGAADARSLAQLTLMLDMLAARGLQRELRGDLADVPHYSLPDVCRLMTDAVARLDGLALPDPDTEAGQSWYLLAPLGVISGLRSRSPLLRERAQRHLQTVRATLALGHRGRDRRDEEQEQDGGENDGHDAPPTDDGSPRT